MLKQINNIYILSSILLYSVLVFKNNMDYTLIIMLNILSVITYSFILYINANIKYYKKKYLMIQVFFYLLLFIIFNNLISYFYANNFWVFSKADALFYQQEVLKILDMPVKKALASYLSQNDFADLGMILILYPLYHITESNLMLNIFYLFIGLITALSIFRISNYFMSKKYAYLATLTYSLASFVIYFHSIGLKESFMVMLILLSFEFYFRYVHSENFLHLFVSFLFILSITLFRPAISGMIMVSIGMGSILTKKGSLGLKITSFAIILLLISISGEIITILNKYTSGGFDSLIYSKESEDMVKGGLGFTYAVNILSQFIGPLPTLVSEKIQLTFYAPGLIYRLLLAFPFWFGVIYIFKTKSYKLYPLVLFVLFEMLSLSAILEGLELRKALPHLAIVFIIAFWFLDKYDKRVIINTKRKQFKIFYRTSTLLLTLIILFWNLK